MDEINMTETAMSARVEAQANMANRANTAVPMGMPVP